MKKQDYNAVITVNVTATEAQKGIGRVSEWWTANFEGASQNLNDIFTVHFGETFVTFKITEVDPEKKIVWSVTDCYLDWLADKKEWKDTTIDWEISATENSTQISMTHVGLVPAIACYGDCSKGWDHYVKESLFKLLTEGKGLPEPVKDKK